MPYSRGDVVLVLYPDSNLRTAKRWPASRSWWWEDCGRAVPRVSTVGGANRVGRAVHVVAAAAMGVDVDESRADKAVVCVDDLTVVRHLEGVSGLDINNPAIGDQHYACL